MKSSILFYRDRGDNLQVIDSEALVHTDGLSPILLIAVAVINAGYSGVIVDEYRMANGRYFQSINTNSATPEGRILASFSQIDPQNLPAPEAVLEEIRNAYRNGEGLL